MKKKCYTYYEEIKTIDACAKRKCTQKELLDLCKISWKKNGWDLIILDHSTAASHDFFPIYSSVVKKLPSINPKKYDYHCFIRWLAMAVVGGGLMIDYDVVNLGFENIEEYKEKIAIYQGHVPCVVQGTEDQYLEMCMNFCKLKDCISNINKKPHVSDMIMLASGKIDFKKFTTVVDYPSSGILVHCSQWHCEKNNKNKVDAMKELIQL